jgi:hypothetical protein
MLTCKALPQVFFKPSRNSIPLDFLAVTDPFSCPTAEPRPLLAGALLEHAPRIDVDQSDQKQLGQPAWARKLFLDVSP